MTKDEFLARCAKLGLKTNPEIAAAFNVSAQTVRNWMSKGDIPGWLGLAVVAYEALGPRVRDAIPDYPRVSREWFSKWQRRNGLVGCTVTGEVFGVTRQAVHNWGRRGRIPVWIGMACIGFEQARGRA